MTEGPPGSRREPGEDRAPGGGAPAVLAAPGDVGAVLFFDSPCGLCSRAVAWTAARDRAGRIWYAPLQGETARRLLGDLPPDSDTAVLIEGGRVRVRSDAVLRVLWLVGGLWRLGALLRVVPRPLRDAVYRFVSRRRDRWFARTPVIYPESGPSPVDVKARFLP